MKIVLVIAAIGILLALILAFRRKMRASELPRVGAMAPEFTLKSQNSTQVSLKEYRGKWVVVYFYPKDLTPGCTIEARNFQRDSTKYEQRNAVILGVSVQGPDSHRDFCTKEGLAFTLLADEERKASAAYGSLTDLLVTSISARHTFLIDPEGRIAKIYNKVSVGSHSDELLADLDSLRNASGQKAS